MKILTPPPAPFSDYSPCDIDDCVLFQTSAPPLVLVVPAPLEACAVPEAGQVPGADREEHVPHPLRPGTTNNDCDNIIPRESLLL